MTKDQANQPEEPIREVDGISQITRPSGDPKRSRMVFNPGHTSQLGELVPKGDLVLISGREGAWSSVEMSTILEQPQVRDNTLMKRVVGGVLPGQDLVCDVIAQQIRIANPHPNLRLVSGALDNPTITLQRAERFALPVIQPSGEDDRTLEARLEDEYNNAQAGRLALASLPEATREYREQATSEINAILGTSDNPVGLAEYKAEGLRLGADVRTKYQAVVARNKTS